METWRAREIKERAREIRERASGRIRRQCGELGLESNMHRTCSWKPCPKVSKINSSPSKEREHILTAPKKREQIRGTFIPEPPSRAPNPATPGFRSSYGRTRCIHGEGVTTTADVLFIIIQIKEGSRELVKSSERVFFTAVSSRHSKILRAYSRSSCSRCR